ncbi:MAG: tetratricopeptide repeat protein [Bacteroidales bacterium]|nr:tetratricopeptide repeat protein [Bacteroidales bacterium]
MKKILIYFLIILFFLFNNLLAQNSRIEKLENKLDSVAGINKVNVLCELVWEYRNILPEKSIKYGEQALKLAKEINFKPGEGISLYYIGIGYYYLTNYDKALEYYFRSIKILENLNAKFEVAEILNNIGDIYKDLNYYDISLEYYNKSIKQFREYGNKKNSAAILKKIGEVYILKGDYNNALEYLLKSSKIIKENNDKYSIAETYSEIGDIYTELVKYNKALEFYKKSSKLQNDIGDTNGVAINVNNIGYIYLLKNDFYKAFSHFKKSLKLSKDIKSKGLIKKNYYLLARLFFEINDYKIAFKYYRFYSEIKDSIYNEERNKRITEMKVKYNTVKKERENEILRRDINIQKLKISKEQNVRNSIMIISILALLLVLILVVFIYNRYREKQKINIQLEKRVKERTKKLQQEIIRHEQTAYKLKKAKEKAEESDKLKTRFLSNMSHEIRTPMNVILGFSNLLSDPALTKKEKKEFIMLINNNGIALLNIINDIIDIAKIEAGQLKIKEEKCQINKILNELYLSYNDKLIRNSKNNIELLLSRSNNDNEFTILTDPQRIRQIISNLLNNSIKNIDNGFIEFGYYIKNQQDKSLIEFFVTDTGIGIPSDKLGIIFDRFRQVDDLGTRKTDGTGLGLAISKNLVKLLNGNMYVESEVGKGTKFYFTIPYKPAKINDMKVSVAKISKKEYNWKDKTILIAEDIESNYKVIEIILKKTKAKLIWAKNGLETVDICKSNDKIDIVLMDIRMPVMNGLKATKEIKKHRKNLPVIAQSAYALVEDIEKSYLAGCDDHITKPLNPRILLSTIAKYIDKKSKALNLA